MDALRRPRVLLVEDDARSGRKLADMLREDGYDVDLALDGAAAIARLTRWPSPDVLVTDLNLPNVDGLTVARYARSRRHDVPVVIVTGYPHLLLQAPDPLDPAPTVFTKPIDYAELTTMLAGLGPGPRPI
jgi:CheY-like chemotaxis protein